VRAPDRVIAVVDDEEPVRRALLRLLRADGLQGVGFGCGADFLTALATTTPSCVVLDLHMHGMSGLQVQRQLAHAWPDLPVIVVTGQHTAETEAQVRACHPAAYLRKPLDGTTLLGAIRTAIERAAT
jgi:FixJ family two-component response regulator